MSNTDWLIHHDFSGDPWGPCAQCHQPVYRHADRVETLCEAEGHIRTSSALSGPYPFCVRCGADSAPDDDLPSGAPGSAEGER